MNTDPNSGNQAESKNPWTVPILLVIIVILGVTVITLLFGRKHSYSSHDSTSVVVGNTNKPQAEAQIAPENCPKPKAVGTTATCTQNQPAIMTSSNKCITTPAATLQSTGTIVIINGNNTGNINYNYDSPSANAGGTYENNPENSTGASLTKTIMLPEHFENGCTNSYPINPGETVNFIKPQGSELCPYFDPPMTAIWINNTRRNPGNDKYMGLRVYLDPNCRVHQKICFTMKWGR